MKLALVVLALGACAAPLRRANQIGGAVALGTLACDWRETRSMAENGWSGTFERNPVMGSKPPAATVDVYFAGVAALGGTLWTKLPEYLRAVAWIGVTAAQLNTLRSNARWVSPCAL